MKDEKMLERRKAAWKDSIFATTGFEKDLRRSSTVRGIYNEGFDAGAKAAMAQVDDDLHKIYGDWDAESSESEQIGGYIEKLRSKK